jgi:hypothetical protein
MVRVPIRFTSSKGPFLGATLDAPPRVQTTVFWAMMIRLVSSEQDALLIPEKTVRMSGSMSRMLDEGMSGRSELSFPTLKTWDLQIVVTYMCHHVDRPARAIPAPLGSRRLDSVVSEWDMAFVKGLSTKEILAVVKIAHQLEITTLVHLLCAALADSLRRHPATAAIRLPQTEATGPPVDLVALEVVVEPVSCPPSSEER